MEVAFRTDASIQIGTGHVMRCLTLADALRNNGAHCIFICRTHQGHLMELIKARGYDIYALPMGFKNCNTVDSLMHSSWLGVDWMEDAEKTRQILIARNIDWLIVDHYALDYRWEEFMQEASYKLMVIDDLADRSHKCDLLLDQNLGRKGEDYAELLQLDTKLLIGPQYALLDSDFNRWREYSIRRRSDFKIKNLSINMGGVDQNNITTQILESIICIDFSNDFSIKIIMGSQAPFINEVKSAAFKLKCHSEVLVGISNMAEIIANTDLAIGGAGVAALERCTLGVPSLIYSMAENQAPIAMALQQAGAAIVFEDINSLPSLISEANLDSSNMRTMSISSARLSDGLGVPKIIQKITEIYA